MKLIKVVLLGLLTTLFACSSDDSIPNPESCFNFNPTSDIKDGDQINFTSCSENANSYMWDFGDGSSSTQENPTHIYQTFGNFTITLTVSNSTGTDSTAKTISVANQNPQFGKYFHENGYGGALEFKENNILILSGPTGSATGSYNMITATKAEISLGGYGDGEFINNFKSFTNPQGTWTK